MEQEQREKTEPIEPVESEDRLRIRRRLKWGCLGTLCVLLILFAVFQVAVTTWANLQINGWSRTSSDEWKDFLNNPVIIPPILTDPPTISESLKRKIEEAELAQRNLSEDNSEHKPSDIYTIRFSDLNSMTLTASELEQIKTIEEYYRPYSDKIRQVIEQIKIDFQTSEKPRLANNIIDPYIAFHLLGMRAVLVAQNGTVNDTVEEYLRILWLAAVFSPGDESSHWITAKSRDTAIYYLEYLAAQSNDSQLLQKILTNLNQLDPYLNRGLAQYATAILLNFKIQHLNRRHTNIEIAPDKTGAEYMKEILAYDHPSLGFAGSLRLFTENILAGYQLSDRKYEFVYLEFLRSLTITGAIDKMYFFKSLWFSPENIRKREQGAELAMNQLRLEIATRLYKLETGKEPASQADLVPKWLPEEIIDRETRKPFTLDEAGNWFPPK